jgi:hypothetical protein
LSAASSAAVTTTAGTTAGGATTGGAAGNSTGSNGGATTGSSGSNPTCTGVISGGPLAAPQTFTCTAGYAALPPLGYQITLTPPSLSSYSDGGWGAQLVAEIASSASTPVGTYASANAMYNWTAQVVGDDDAEGGPDYSAQNGTPGASYQLNITSSYQQDYPGTMIPTGMGYYIGGTATLTVPSGNGVDGGALVTQYSFTD